MKTIALFICSLVCGAVFFVGVVIFCIRDFLNRRF